MRLIKLYEGFIEIDSLRKSINDILVELGDIDIEWVVSSHNSGEQFRMSRKPKDKPKSKTVIGVEIFKEEVRDDDDYNPDGIYDEEFGIEANNLFTFEDIYEPVMTLLSFMRDKYPDMTIECFMNVNNLPETDDWFEEFLKENDLESIDLDDVKQFTNITSFDIEFTI